jgi:hypothetical protein
MRFESLRVLLDLMNHITSVDLRNRSMQERGLSGAIHVTACAYVVKGFFFKLLRSVRVMDGSGSTTAGEVL